MKKILTLSFLSAIILVKGLCAGLDPATMMPNEWEEFRFERLAVIRANPKLAVENKLLESAMQAQADEVEAEMIKANPEITPLLSKVKKLLRSNWYALPADTLAISAGEWHEIRAARAQALQANPKLAAANKALLKKKEAFNAKADAALVKADPSLAPFIRKLQARDGLGTGTQP